jgi:mannose-6-phosphate isomerase-like protein (cupin superfamily)
VLRHPVRVGHGHLRALHLRHARRWGGKDQLVTEALEAAADSRIQVPDNGDVDQRRGAVRTACPGTRSEREVPMDAKVNLDRQCGRFHDHWSPRIVATVNDYDIKLVKVQGEFVWHQHHDTVELFLVIDGRLRVQLQDHDDVVLGPGELFVVPRGVRHCPAADQETRVLLLELQDTVNTGDATRVGTVGERLT